MIASRSIERYRHNTMASIPRPNPKLMVVGDSLAQGCRSLTVKSHFSSHSYSKIIADSQGWEFVTPDFPRPVVLDFEQELLNLKLHRVVGAGKRLNQNLAGWLADFSSGRKLSNHSCFDNLAIAGVSLSQFESFQAGNLRRNLASNLPAALSESLFDKFKRIGDLHLGINGAFTLNPSQNPAYDTWDQLKWVEKRKPENLIFHCGHNDGVYDVGSNAAVVNLKTKTWPKYKKQLERLKTLPKQTKRIVVVLLPRLSSVANLAPQGPIQSNGYAKQYETVFPIVGKSISGKTLEQIDNDTKWVNTAIRKLLHSFNDPRFVVVDTYRILKKYDFKNYREPSRQLSIKKLRIDNRYLHWHQRTRKKKRGSGYRYYHSFNYEHGGLQSLDGMHPSGPGYAMFACEIMNKLDLLYDKKKVLERGLESEILFAGKRIGEGFCNLRRTLSTISRFVPKPDEKDLNAGTLAAAACAPFQTDL